MNYDEILDHYYVFEDADADCLRDYFYSLLHTLWVEGEGFSGKRPFGNSGWDIDVAYALVDSGAVQGTLEWNEAGYIEYSEYDEKDVYALVPKLIAYCFYGVRLYE